MIKMLESLAVIYIYQQFKKEKIYTIKNKGHPLIIKNKYKKWRVKK